MFMITLQPQGNETRNIYIRDTLPAGLIYRNNVVISGAPYNYAGDIISGINLGTVAPGQQVTITYQAQVAPVNYGTSTLTNNVFVTADGCSPSVNNASVTVTYAAVYGATTVSTGLTNNIIADSFIIPLILALMGIWVFKSGILKFEEWADAKKSALLGYKANKLLKSKIAQIQNLETV